MYVHMNIYKYLTVLLLEVDETKLSFNRLLNGKFCESWEEWRAHTDQDQRPERRPPSARVKCICFGIVDYLNAVVKVRLWLKETRFRF